MKLVTLGPVISLKLIVKQKEGGKVTTSGDDIPPVTMLGPCVFQIKPFSWGGCDDCICYKTDV